MLLVDLLDCLRLSITSDLLPLLLCKRTGRWRKKSCSREVLMVLGNVWFRNSPSLI